MKRAVFFDIDGTLVACQTQKILSQFMYDVGIIHVGHVLQICLWYVGYGLGFFKETVGLRKKFYQYFSLRSKEEIDALILKAYKMLIFPRLRKRFLPLVAEFKEQGYMTVAVSGTLQQFCDLIGSEFGIDYSFGTKLSTRDGFYNGDWDGAVLEGISKAEFISKFAQGHNIDLGKSICYADSCMDIPSMELFGKAIAVMPDRRLMLAAKRIGWEILDVRAS